ncbi:NAD(P)-binding protein [Delitschia confertaspora ATCC 74209]|uniref:NAD(P)-binding protein n=1 Tax=Delitschia confertaspora ATCC 74209 TaxID=1513339 RepID=A0A9P4MNI5_9PLEO|nr:NAD(P)-binding protein [Delitschia confertaspora ATCC 74209]
MASQEEFIPYSPPAPAVQEQDLEGKVAVVTGATQGIGRSIALNLATRGASILGTYSSPESAHNFDTLHHTINDLYSRSNHRYTPKLFGLVANIKVLLSTHAICEAIENEFFGKVDILVLNASHNVRPKLGEATLDDIADSLTANIQWPAMLVEDLVRRNLFQYNSRVITISSDRVRSPNPGSAIYSASKSALESLTRSWAVELPLTFPGTTANAVSVGLTDTPQLREFPGEVVEKLKEEIVPKVRVQKGGRMGFAEDVSDVVGWLVSEKSRWVTGSVVAANGGAIFIG